MIVRASFATEAVEAARAEPPFRVRSSLSGGEATGKFGPTGLGENAKWVEPALVHQVAQVGNSLVWRQIRIDNRSGYLFGAFDDLGPGQDTHPADFCVNLDQGRNVWFVVLQPVDIGNLCKSSCSDCGIMVGGVDWYPGLGDEAVDAGGSGV
jgi:hypothetical protein